MKGVLLLMLLWAGNAAISQSSNAYSFNKKGKLLKEAELSPLLLAQKITTPYQSNKEKVSAIFSWITENISYKVNDRFNRQKNAFIEEDDDGEGLKPLNERVAESVLKRKVAVCDGYSRLFKTLCDYAGIQSEIITGYARTSGGIGKKFRSNHNWNAVYIDSAWFLVDATWASGFTNFSGDQFIKQYDPYYFLTPPQHFIRDHYPEDIRWTLMKSPSTPKDFYFSPFKHTAFVKFRIQSFSPASGILQANLGDTLHFTLESFAEEKKVFITDISSVHSIESTLFTHPEEFENNSLVEGDVIRCHYVVNNPSAEWVNVVFNEEVVLRYKLNVKANTALK